MSLTARNTECRGTAEVRERIFPELLNELSVVKPDHPYLLQPPKLHRLDINLAQFMLDCTSYNLNAQLRISTGNGRV